MTMDDKKESDAVKMAVALKRMEEEVSSPRYVEMQRMIAKDRKTRFDAYMAAGFSEDQSLKIILTRE